MPWPLTHWTDTGTAQLTLRRYEQLDEAPCPRPDTGGLHDAESAVIAVVPEWLDERGIRRPDLPAIAEDDPRWPTHCACGHAFGPDVLRQRFTLTLYACGGERRTQRELPVGAIFEATWLSDLPRYTRHYGTAWIIVVPGKGRHNWQWAVTGPATNGPGWDVTGEWPTKVTARPSIGAPHYHGWLTDGVLSDDLEGRRYA